MSHGEGEAPQGSPFPQHWISLGVLRHSITSTRDGVGVVSTWLLWRASATLLPAQGLTSLCRHGGDICSTLLVLAGATGSRTRPSRQLTAEGVRKKGKGPEIKLPPLIHSPQKPSQKSAKVQWLKSALRKPKVLNKFIDGQ